jgi:hypothetical protein
MSTTTMRTTRSRLAGMLLAVAVLAGVTGACSTGQPAATSSDASSATGSPEGYTVVSEPSLRPGDPLPAPTEEVVLTVTGDLAQGSEAAFDIPTLERLGLVEYSVDDKQAEGRRVMARGVLLGSLLAYVGAEQATTLHTTALNDYAVDIPVSDSRDLPVMVATSVDGSRLTVEHYGPTRVVYPTDGVALDPVTYDPRWIWQLKTIEVR